MRASVELPGMQIGRRSLMRGVRCPTGFHLQNPLLHRHSPIQPRPPHSYHTYTTVQTPVATPQTAIRWPSTLLNPHQVPG
jgi:hypothetical protein